MTGTVIARRYGTGGLGPPLGIHLLMRESAREKIANSVANLKTGRIVPVEMILRLAE